MIMRHILKVAVGRFCLSALFAIGIAGFCGQASAAVTAGCNINVWHALAAKADAQVAYDNAVAREMLNKPDSVLTLTCFDQAAGVSAATGGGIFSGDFTADLKNIMPVNLPSDGKYNCPEIGNLWNKIVTEGINAGAPYASFDDMVNGLPAASRAAAGPDFIAGWDAAHTAGILGASSDLSTAVSVLTPSAPPLNFSGAKSSCDVLVTAGIIPGPC